MLIAMLSKQLEIMQKRTGNKLQKLKKRESLCYGLRNHSILSCFRPWQCIAIYASDNFGLSSVWGATCVECMALANPSFVPVEFSSVQLDHCTPIDKKPDVYHKVSKIPRAAINRMSHKHTLSGGGAEDISCLGACQYLSYMLVWVSYWKTMDTNNGIAGLQRNWSSSTGFCVTINTAVELSKPIFPMCCLKWPKVWIRFI